MRTSSFALGLACIVPAACGARTGSDDLTEISYKWGSTGGNNSAIATGGFTFATGGFTFATEGVKPATGGSPTKATGGYPMKATGGKSATGGAGGGGATVATGGLPIKVTGGSSAGGVGGGGTTATGGYPVKVTGGSSAGGVAGSGGTKATGGSSASGVGGATNATGGSSASGGSGGAGGGTVITSCNDNFPFLGTWKGNILDFYFEPKQAIVLELYKDASGNVAGKFTWGAGAPPPAPEGADIPYPPGYWDSIDKMPGPLTPDPWPGFAYTVVRGAGCDTTFRFAVSTDELWQDWCTLQTPVYTVDYDSWGCTLRGGGSSDGKTCTVQPSSGTWATYPMWKCTACGAFTMDGGVCGCDKTGCFANTTATHTFNLAYSLSGGTQILSGPDPSCGDCTVRMERQN